MKTQPRLVRVVTPPPLGPSNLLWDNKLKKTTTNALSLHLSKTIPTSTPRTNQQHGGSSGTATTSSTSQHHTSSSSSTHTTSSVSTAGGSCKIQNIANHPSEPLVAYLMVPDGSDYYGISSSSSSSSSSKKVSSSLGITSSGGYSPLSMVIVQDSKTRQTLFSMSLGDMARTLFDYDTLSKNSIQRQAKILRDLGQVIRLDFFDPSTLYWSGYGIYEVIGSNNDNNNIDSSSRSLLLSSLSTKLNNLNSNQVHHKQRWSHLFVQFTNKILIINLRRNSIPITSATTIVGTTAGGTSGGSFSDSIENAYRPLLAHITQEALGSSITSNAIPISHYCLLVGTSDGALKVFDWSKNLVSKSVKLLLNKSDWIVHICATNKYPTRQHERAIHNNFNQSSSQALDASSAALSLSSTATSNTNNNNNISASNVPSKFVILTKRGIAYIIEMILDYTKNPDGSPTVVDINPPLAKLDNGGSVPIPILKSEHSDDFASMEHIYAQYDGFRDLLLWSSPAKSKAKVFVYDLSQIKGTGTTGDNTNSGKLGLLSTPKQSRSKKSSNNEMLKPDPLLVLQFPYETYNTIYPGWMHESVPNDSMTCVAVTREGEFQLLVAPLYNSGSSIKSPFNAVPISKANLCSIVHSKYLDVIGGDIRLGTIQPPMLKITSVYCPPLRDTSTFYIGTNMGILLIRMIDSNLVPIPGPSYAHLSANMGSLGKSVLMVKHSEIIYGALEPAGINSTTITTTTSSSKSKTSSSATTATTSTSAAQNASINPIGMMELSQKSGKKIVVYDSPPPLHLPSEIHKRPVRLPPCFLPSPSRNYLCCFWKEEMRYEVLHIPTMLTRVTSRTDSGNSPVVASGNGVASFAWVGDNDAFALLYNPQQDKALKVGIDIYAATSSSAAAAAAAAASSSSGGTSSGGRGFTNAASKVADLSKLRELGRLKEFATGGAAALGSAVGKSRGKVNLSVKTARAGTGNPKGRTSVAIGGTKKAVGVATFGLLGGKRNQRSQVTSPGLAHADSDDEEETGPEKSAVEVAAAALAEAAAADEINDDDATLASESVSLERKHPWVELRVLVGNTASTSELGGSTSAATASNLGQLTLRSGNRNPPTVLFGGPVLCVASKLYEDDEGLAYFYTRKKGQDDTRAAIYVSSGPAFPCPDLIAWDDDGRLCAVVIQARVAIYLSDEPDFILLGTVRVGSSTDADIKVVSVKFIHGVLYCSTRSSVHCIFLGDLDGGICHLDVFTLASTEVPTLPSRTIVTDHTSLTPPTIPMPLNNPIVLGYQNGSLVLSTNSGIQAIPLNHPLLRIGALIGAGHHPRAQRWFDAVTEPDHEALASFLDRRGVPELALELSGLSLETTVDLCMRYGFTDRLEVVVDQYGLKGLRAIDMGRGLSSNIFGLEENGTSIVVCVGAYLLSQGKIELVRRLATECLSSGEDGKRDAFLLATLLLSVDGNDAKRVVQRAVEDIDDDSDWIVGNYVRDHVLSRRIG